MRIGIVGPAERAVAWENHLRPHPSVSEVVIAPTLNDVGSVNACLLLDDSEDRMAHLLEAVKSGFHTFLISKLPTQQAWAEKVYYASQEANVCVQFSHWPTIAPASQWMAQKVKKPTFIQANRTLTHTKFLENNLTFSDLWVDDLAYCLKYMNSAVHQTSVNTSKLHSSKRYAIQITLRFDSGATASLFTSICGEENSHRRLVSNNAYLLDCNVNNQQVRIGRENESNHLFFEKKMFDSTLSAENAVTQFLKALQLNKPSLYNSYDLLCFTNLLEDIKSQF